MSDTFYEIAEQYQSVVDLIEDMTDPDSAETDETILEAVQNALDEVEGSLQDKTENILRLLASWEVLSEAIKAEKDRLAAKQKALQARSDRLRQYVLRHMQARDIKKIETAVRNVTRVAGRDRVVVDDLNALPQGTFDTEYIIKPDKKLIMERHKAGMETDGAHIERGDDYLLIK